MHSKSDSNLNLCGISSKKITKNDLSILLIDRVAFRLVIILWIRFLAVSRKWPWSGVYGQFKIKYPSSLPKKEQPVQAPILESHPKSSSVEIKTYKAERNHQEQYRPRKLKELKLCLKTKKDSLHEPEGYLPLLQLKGFLKTFLWLSLRLSCEKLNKIKRFSIFQTC